MLARLALVCGTSLHPVHRQLRSASKGSIVEFSTPFLHRWKRSKARGDFLVFYVVFLLVRVVWVPYFLYETYVYMGYLEATVMCGYVFCVLQLVWFYKLTLIAVDYKVPREVLDDKKME